MASKLSYIKALVKEWFLGIYFRDFNLFYFKRIKNIINTILANSNKSGKIEKVYLNY
jgi:hypothetical protein